MPTLVGFVLRPLRALRLARRPGPPRRSTLHGPTLPAGRDLDGLTPWQATKAQRRLDALRPADRQLVQGVLATADPEQRAPVRRALAVGLPAADVLNLGWLVAGKPAGWLAEHLRLVDVDQLAQRRFGVPVDQVDGTTCGTTVLIVLAAQTDPQFALRLTDSGAFGAQFDDLQRSVHKQSNRVWPRALGTSPWGMVGWLRRHAPGAGPYRARLVDDSSTRDMDAVLREVTAALDTGTAVPLLIGGFVPRHYVLALAQQNQTQQNQTQQNETPQNRAQPDQTWRVFEPSSGEVRDVDLAAIRQHQLAGLLGFDRLHAVLLPAG